jgi:hypothetical protein
MPAMTVHCQQKTLLHIGEPWHLSCFKVVKIPVRERGARIEADKNFVNMTGTSRNLEVETDQGSHAALPALQN